MTFLSPASLWFLATAFLPVAIHLANRHSRKTLPWAATRFLRESSRKVRGTTKLRHLLILICRTLAIAALALAAARPVVSRLPGWGGGADTIVLLLDRSPSMERKPTGGRATRRQLALETTRDALSFPDSPRLVILDSASGNPREMPAPSVIPGLSGLSATDAAADFPSLLSRAAEFLAETPGRSEIWIASDLQTANWLPHDERWNGVRSALAALPRPPTVRLLSSAGNPAGNLAIRVLSCQRESGEMRIEAEISRSSVSPDTSTVPLAIRWNGGEITETLRFSGDSLHFTKRLPVPEGTASGFGSLALPPDANGRDNTSFFAYGPAPSIRSLVVCPAGETATCLAIAAAPPGSGTRAEPVSPEDFPRTDLSGIAAIFWAAAVPTGKSGELLLDYLAEGGQILLFPPGEPTGETFNDIGWSPPEDAEPGNPFLIHRWNRANGILRDGLDGIPLAAPRLSATRRQIPGGDITPFAWWQDGKPAAVRRISDHGALWCFSTRPETAWSDLSSGELLVPLVRRIVLAGAERFDSSRLASVGEGMVSSARISSAPRLDPPGVSSPWQAGVFQLDGLPIALNRPASEDSRETLDRSALDHLFSGISYSVTEQTDAPPVVSRDLRPILCATALFLLLAEALLCLPARRPTISPA